MNPIEYKFKIDAWTPDTLPMKRLAEYMAELATLYGSQESVHFVRLEKGSAVLVKKIEYESVPKVKERLEGIKHRDAPQDAIEAYSALDKMLAQDNATGSIEVLVGKRKTAKILEFPGRQRETVQKFGPVFQDGSIDGVLIRIGGTDDTVPVLLLEEETIKRHCTCKRETARQLATYIFGPVLRVFGSGKWQRDDFGNWAMERFYIHSFKPLDPTSLMEVTAQLRGIPTDLQSLDDPLREIRELRHGGDKG